MRLVVVVGGGGGGCSDVSDAVQRRALMLIATRNHPYVPLRRPISPTTKTITAKQTDDTDSVICILMEMKHPPPQSPRLQPS